MKGLLAGVSTDRRNQLMAVVELINVTKRFGSFTAVDDVTFSLEKGHILSLLGPSGCGKTTTLRMIAGFEDPNEGDVLISGESMLGKRPYERNVGLLFQDYALFPHMNVEQNIAYGLKRRKFDRSTQNNRVKEMLELVKLEGFADRRPSQLSGGQQQRVALARALATSPEVVLLDEPLSALDAKLRQELRIELKQILSAVEATTIIVTHDQEEAMSLGDSLVVMNEGKIVQEGAPTEIYKNPASRFVAEFIGRSNWLSGTIGTDHEDGLVEFRFDGDLSILIPKPNFESESYDVCIRPERIRTIEDENIEQSEQYNQLIGTVKDVAHLGSDVHTLVELSNAKFVTVSQQFTGQSLTRYGEVVRLAFRPIDCIVVASDN